MANIMGILGGIGQGVSAGVQDLERMEDAKFRKEQQQREREKFAEEKRVAEQIKGLQGETTPAEYDESMSAITKPSQKLSRSQMLARQADIYSASPDRQNQMLGLQLSQAARAEESADKLKEIQTSYADTVKAINADPNKWVQENLAKFNSDEYGGPGTKGFVAAPMSTPQGTVLNIYGPQGQQASQIPVTKQDMMRVAKSMYFDQLASIDPKYAELAMQQEKIGLQRMANETDAQFKARQADYYAGRLGLDREEFGLKKSSGYFAKAEQPFTPIGLSDDGTKILGRVGNRLVEQPVPAGYSKGLFPKVTGTSSPKRDETLKEWAAVERDLMKNETKPEVIRQQQIQFYARRGVAPQEAEDVITSGTHKGKPLTEKDVDDYNRRYPNSKVNKAELEWLKK